MTAGPGGRPFVRAWQVRCPVDGDYGREVAMAGRGEGDTDLSADLAGLVAPLVNASGLELLDVEVKGYPGRRVVRLVVDSEDGVDVEACADLSRRVGALLEGDDLIAGSYTLQVTSPGVDRPLRTPRDFARNLGRTVRVWTRPPHDERPREVVGVIAAVGEEAVTLEVDGDAIALALADVDRGRVQLPW